MLALLLVIAIIVVAYAMSLRRNPLWPCWRCGGAKRLYSKLFPRAHRRCPACGGRGERARLGVRLFMRGTAADIRAGRHGKNY
jgi:rRNA maturation endonuclease Nob1